MFVMVMLCEWLDAPTTTDPKLSAVGEMENKGAATDG